VDSYLNHFGGTQHNSSFSSRNLTHPRHHQRKLAVSLQDPELVIAGKMTVEDGPCNIAQLDLKTSKWSLPERIQLSLYNSYSGGEVYSLLANYTQQIPPDDNDDTDGTRKYVRKCVESVCENLPSIVVPLTNLSFLSFIV
jgi:hypothetical protein